MRGWQYATDSVFGMALGLPATLATDATRDLRPLRTCLRDWQTTAEALSDTARRLLQNGAADEDFAEVERPA